MSIIGGDYTVDHITVQHLERFENPDLFIGGKLTVNDVSSGFSFLLEYNVCSVLYSTTIPAMNEGVFDI
jgi:hypothetical protein